MTPDRSRATSRTSPGEDRDPTAPYHLVTVMPHSVSAKLAASHPLHLFDPHQEGPR